jgi:hypothetical protein
MVEPPGFFARRVVGGALQQGGHERGGVQEAPVEHRVLAHARVAAVQRLDRGAWHAR